MIDRGHRLPLTRQGQILGLSRASLYYEAVPLSVLDLELMRLIDEIHLKYPFYGVRRVRNELRDLGHDVGRQHVGTLMRRMGISALYQKPRLSIPHPEHKIYPYLDLSIPASWPGDHPRKSRLGNGYNVSSDGQGVLLSRGGHGLGKPKGTCMAAVKHTGRLVLHGGS